VRHSCRWWVPARGVVGGKSGFVIQTAKVPGTDVLITETLRTYFFTGGGNYQRLSPSSRTAPCAVTILLDAGGELPHWVGSNGRGNKCGAPLRHPLACSLANVGKTKHAMDGCGVVMSVFRLNNSLRPNAQVLGEFGSCALPTLLNMFSWPYLVITTPQ
jgi:hypothetical protein